MSSFLYVSSTFNESCEKMHEMKKKYDGSNESEDLLYNPYLYDFYSIS